MKKLSYLFALLAFITSCQSKVTPKPIADFDFAAVSGTPGTIQFTDKSQNADRYQWIFSDGQASTEKSPVITFKNNGTYSASLTVKNSTTTDDQTTKSFTVTDLVTTGTIVFWTNGSANLDISVYVEGALKGLVTQAVASAPTCGADGTATATLPAGTYGYYATSKTRSWSGSITVTNGTCTAKLLPQ